MCSKCGMDPCVCAILARVKLNAQTLPRRYYGMHMLPGVAEYREVNKKPYRIYVNEATIKKMDKSFEGKPIYVLHVDGVDLPNLHLEADGFVVKSFYNQFDGKTWAEFLVVSDKGHAAINKGWRLSNAYLPKQFGVGGLWNGVDYQREVTDGEYEHLAIVPNPRYDESVIMTPEQFQVYNDRKASELKRVTNANNTQKKGRKGMFEFFKREKVENGADFESTSVLLPKSKKEMTLAECINLADKVVNMSGYANGDHMVKVGEEEMSVNNLAEEHCKLKSSMAKMKKNQEKEEEEKKKNAVEPVEGEDKPEAKTDDKDAKEDGTKETKVAEEPTTKNDSDAKKKDRTDDPNFKKLQNAPAKAVANDQPVQLQLDRVLVGKQRYGSGK